MGITDDGGGIHLIKGLQIGNDPFKNLATPHRAKVADMGRDYYAVAKAKSEGVFQIRPNS